MFSKKVILSVVICAVGLLGFAQKKCGSDEEYYQKLIKTDREFAKRQKNLDEITKRYSQSNKANQLRQLNSNTPIITIPVVIHVLWNQPYENISDDQIDSQIFILSKDFQLLNDDANKCPDRFKNLQANCQIEFCLARLDQNGNPTNGIERRQTNKTFFSEAEDDAKFFLKGGLDAWDRDKYLNIWVVPEIDNGTTLGYAQFPGKNAATDGVVIQHSFFGIGPVTVGKGRRVTHEVGHWLNLRHNFNFTCYVNDGVDDTPDQYSSYEGQCPTEMPILHSGYLCFNGPNGDMYMNYMSYTDDECKNMFTWGQKERMLACFEPGGDRYLIRFSNACNGISDLIVTNPSVTPSSVIAGNNVTANFIEKNTGSEASGANFVNIHLSPNDVLTPGEHNDIYLGQYHIDQNLSPSSQTDLLSTQITIPAYITPGTYYLFFAADGTGVVNETDNTNNFASAIITVAEGQPQFQISYRYWFDYQFSKAITGNAGYGTDNSILQKEIPVNQLDDGIHALHITFKDQNGKWSSVSTSLFYKQPNIVKGTAQYQYWFDNNFTDALRIYIASTTQTSISTDLDISNLTDGLHTLNTRIRLDGQLWSSVISSFFYKSNELLLTGTSQYEYWFDNDYGNKTTTTLSSTGNLVLLSNLNTDQLNGGLHTFNIRFKPDAKHWSSVISSFFYKSNATPPASAAQYEYWFDNDYSNRKSTNISSTSNLLLLDNIGVNSLSNGLHAFHIRFKPDGKQWSSVVSDSFSKTASVQLGAINGNPSVCQGSTQTYSVATIGCATSYTWTLPPGWTGSSTTNTITTKAGSIGGTITVKANGSCGTNSSQTLNVTIGAPPPAAIAASGLTTFCAGKNVLLKATTGTGYTYQWKKAGIDLLNQTASVYTADAQGAYFVQVTNAAGCSATSTGTNVTVNPVPVATVGVGALSVCKGKTVPLRAVTGAGYSYQWRRGAAILPETASTYTAVESGNYSVVVTNASGCKDTSDFFNVVINPLPLATITPNGPTTFCSKGQVILRANSGIGYTYQWKRGGSIIAGETSFTYKATTTGTYEVVVTNASGCSATSPATTVLVNPLPAATITPAGPHIVCSPGSVVLRANTGTSYTYQWKKSGVNITDNGTSVNFTAIASGVYSVAVTNSFGCTVTSPTVTVTVNSAPAISLVHASPPNICAGQSVLLKTTVGTGYTYKWRRSGILLPETLSTYQAKETGVYTVEVTNVAGCSAVSNAITVTVTPIPVTTVAAAGATTFCQGAKVQLKATVGAGYIYQWRKDGVNLLNEVNSTYDAIATGVYTVFVKNAQGCTAISQGIPVTVKPAPVTTITPNGPLDFKEGGSVTLSVPAVNGQSYQWKKNGTNIAGQTSNSLLANATGSYNVSVTGVNGCLAVSQPVQVSVMPGRPITKAISNEAEFITVYPNPLYRNDYLKIDWGINAAEKGVLVTISDIAGRKINSQLLTSNDKTVRITGASGVYIVEFRWGINKRKIFRVIKID